MTDILEDPTYAVPSPPTATEGVAWLRSHVVRFSDGPDHRRRRSLVDALLAAIPAPTLRRPGTPVATLAAALGLDRSVVVDVRIVAASYQPHSSITADADRAVDRLVAACGGRWDEETAARICVLVQACDATDALVAGAEPPVPATRRIDPDGQEVVVDLSNAPFGAGRHACPGRDHAVALADGASWFRRLHDDSEPLLLPNAWDVASALAFVSAGFAAVGTTSLGVAASTGIPDATGRARRETLALARRLARLPVPVTVDIEGGFGTSPEQIAEVACELSDLGIAGINIEDGRGAGLCEPSRQASVISAIRCAVPALFVNARVDTHWLGVAVDETLDRARRYADAGADGVFIPGLADAGAIQDAVSALDVPLNVLAQRPLAELADLGVRRVSTGSSPYRAALHAAVATVEAIRDGDAPPPAISYDDVERLTAALHGANR